MSGLALLTECQTLSSNDFIRGRPWNVCHSLLSKAKSHLQQAKHRFGIRNGVFADFIARQHSSNLAYSLFLR